MFFSLLLLVGYQKFKRVGLYLWLFEQIR